MGASNEELLKTIRYYQESLDKYSSNGNNHKLLSVIEKLKKLPIATLHLENTGIGRTVNALRKLGGDVGDAAKGLVARWKEMVVQEEVKAKEEAVDESVNVTYSSENEAENYEEAENSCGETKQREKESSSSHRSSDMEKKNSEKYKKEGDKYSSSNSRLSRDKRDGHSNKKSSSKKRRQESGSSSEDRSSKRRHNSSSSEEEEVSERKHSKSKSKRRHRSESSEEEETDRHYKSKKSKSSKDSSDSEDGYRKHKSKSSKSSSGSNKSKFRAKTEVKSQDEDSSSDGEEEKPKYKHGSDTKTKRDSDYDVKSSSKHQSRKSYESASESEDKNQSKHDSKSRHEKESSKSKPHSEKKGKKEDKREESRDKHGQKKDESKKHDDKHKKVKEVKENSKKEKSSSSYKSEENGKITSSKHKTSSEKKSKEKVKSPQVNPEKIMNGIDSGSGASFAEALGMCGPASTKASSSSSSAKKKSSASSSSEKPRSSNSSYVKPGKTEPEEEENVPSLLKEQPSEPLNINISSLLPEITPHYRPLGFPIDSQPKRVLTQDEALSQVISNKNMRTKVYSGNKSHGKVDSLFDLCVRILQDNIDALEYTGGVPYLILKPVLDKATPDQLFNMEHHNPYLIEETDELWQLHCQKEFRNKKREELESWREMYMRCLDEREARLNAITANIKHSQDKSTPLRTTKLAYIDSVVKPPRNILKKQAKNGIVFNKKPSQTPSSRLSALATSGDVGKVAVPNPAGRAVERSSSSSSAAMKPKKAPLMAKTLSLFKNRFRR